MRIEFTTEGGIAYFPGLSRPVVIDTANLPQADAAELKRLLDAADFFEQPALPRTLPKGAADYQQYTISVEDGRRRHAIRLIDPIEDRRLAALVGFLRRLGTRPATLGEPDDPGEPPKRRSRKSGQKKTRD
jgi:hypothetical protein